MKYLIVPLLLAAAVAALPNNGNVPQCEDTVENCAQFHPILDLTAGKTDASSCKRDRDGDGKMKQIITVRNAKPLHRVYLYWDTATGAAPMGQNFCDGVIDSGLNEVLPEHTAVHRADENGVANFRLDVTGCYDNYFVALSAPFRASQCFPSRTEKADQASEAHFYAMSGIDPENIAEIDAAMRDMAVSFRSKAAPQDGSRKAGLMKLAELGLADAKTAIKSLWNLWSPDTYENFGKLPQNVLATTCTTESSSLCTDTTKFTGNVNAAVATRTCAGMAHRCTAEICCEAFPWYASQEFYSPSHRAAPGPGASPAARARWQADPSKRDAYDGAYE